MVAFQTVAKKLNENCVNQDWDLLPLKDIFYIKMKSIFMGT